MDATVERIEAQLKRWSLKIDILEARIQKIGVPAGYDAITHLDELKALHAIAQSKFDALRAAGEKERARLRAEMKIAWNELHAAFKSPLPRAMRPAARVATLKESRDGASSARSSAGSQAGETERPSGRAPEPEPSSRSRTTVGMRCWRQVDN